jgi:hypothetical protein
MLVSSQQLRNLKARAQAGDSAAAAELHQALGPSLAYLVRRSLHAPRRTSGEMMLGAAVDSVAAQERQRVGDSDRAFEDRVAQRLQDSFCSNVSSWNGRQRRMQETIRA